ncbi:MAG TPA: hypothetical protein VGR02_11915 [Thermoanaerobaculia bacterium]|nr:hypothetical protein [Thermoanaerobaculia bacterium]
MILAVAVLVFGASLVLRAQGDIPPFDDLYHLQRMQSFVELDPDRGEHGAFVPWPPLYDLVGGALRHVAPIEWLAPVGFSLLAAFLAWLIGRRLGAVSGLIAGLGLALSPYLIGVSHRGSLDHHWAEPFLLLAILFATVRRNGLALGVAVVLAMFVQTALLPAAALAFVVFFLTAPREGAVGFTIAAAAIALYRANRLPGYPDSAWFLGWPHMWLFAGAALACWNVGTGFSRSGRAEARPHVSLLRSLALGALLALPALPAMLAGARFFGGDPWLTSIAEFQPLFHDRGAIGTDLANLTGGALLLFFIARRHRVLALFGLAYLLFALTSHRFLVPAIPLFILGGAVAAAEPRRRWLALALTLLPPLCYLIGAPHEEGVKPIAEQAAQLRALPRGRVLALWSLGHAIHVLGQKPVVIDNFGSMPDQTVFGNACDALLQTHPDRLLAWCRDREVRYLVLTAPSGLLATAAAVGIDPARYASTPLARRTVWWRLRAGEAIAGFRPVGGTRDLKVWQIE